MHVSRRVEFIEVVSRSRRPRGWYRYPRRTQASMVVLSPDGSPNLEVLREFYLEFVDAPNSLRYAAADMLALLSRIESAKCVDSAWTYTTSHLTLHLWSVDDPSAWISIHSDGAGHMRHLSTGLADNDLGEFEISYEMREKDAPWPGSTVHMVARTVVDAIELIGIAAAQCARSVG